MRSSISHLMLWIFSIIGFLGCSSPKLQECQKKGQKIVKEMLADLSTVENKEDMQRVAPRVKKHVENLTSLMIEAKIVQRKSKDFFADLMISEELSERFQAETARLIAIEGVENILSEIEQESLHRLHAFALSKQER